MKVSKARKWLAGLLTVIMTISMLPVSAFAVEIPDAQARAAASPVCTCTELCSEENRAMDCPVCGSESADLSLCMQSNAAQDPVVDSSETNSGDGNQQENPAETNPEDGNQQENSSETESGDGSQQENPSETEPEDENQQSNPSETEPEDGNQQESQDETENLPEESETYKETEEDTPDGYCSVMALDGTAYSVPLPTTSEQVPIENIINEDSSGRKMMYVTLRDTKNRIVSTTDPDYSVDSYYRNSDTKKVALRQAMTVYLNFASIRESGLPDGVSKDVYYYLDLPKELVPDEKDQKDRWLVNPDEPIELFHNGVIRAFGGIYTTHDTDKPWRLKLNFVDTEDQVGISGGFQYTVTIRDDLMYDHTYDAVDFGGAGQLSFTTEQGKTVVKSDYDLSISGVWNGSGDDEIDDGNSDTKINWTAVLSDNTIGPHGMKPSIDKTLTLDMPDGHGLVDTWSHYKYGDPSNCPFAVWVTYTDDTRVKLTPCYNGYWTFFDPPKAGSSNGSFAGEFILKVEQPNRFVDGINTNSFISNQLKFVFKDVNWRNNTETPVKDVLKWEIEFSTTAYDNVGAAESTYTVNGALNAALKDGKDLVATSSLKRKYGSVSVNASASANSQPVTFGCVPETVTTTVDIDQKGKHAGNYLSFEYKPNKSNSLGANYYVSAKTASSQSSSSSSDIVPLSSSSNSDSLFSSIKINGSEIGWSSSGVWGGPASGMLSGTFNDSALEWQVKKMFPDTHGVLWFFKSTQAKPDGKYYWLVIDDSFKKNADSCNSKSWRGYSQSDGWTDYPRLSSATIREPGTWKVYIFNAAGEDIDLEFKEHLGDYSGTDTDSGGSITNEITLDNGQEKKTVQSGWGNGKKLIANLEAEYVAGTKYGMGPSDDKEYNNLIKWEMDLDVSDFHTINRSTYTDYFFRVYARVPKNMSIAQDSLIDYKGYKAPGDLLWVQSKEGNWGPRTSPGVLVDNNSSDAEELWEKAGFNKNTDSSSYNLYYWDTYGSGPISPDTYGGGSEKKFHCAFFMKVVGEAASKDGYNVGLLDCQAVLHDFSGDIPGGMGNPLLNLEARASAVAPQFTLTKNVSSVTQTDQKDTDLHKTKMAWHLDSRTYTNSNFLNGVWSVEDSMKDSVVKKGDSVIDEVDPSSYTTLESLFFVAAGPGPTFLYTFSKEELEKAAEASDHKVTYSYDTTTDGTACHMTAELTYSGNMKDGFALRLKGLNRCAQVQINYTTVLDDVGLCQAIDASDLSAAYEVELKNAAAKGWMHKKASPTTTTGKTTVAAALAIKKTVEKIQDIGFTDSYTIQTTIGASPTTYLHLTDYISGYLSPDDWESSSEEGTIYNSEKHLEAVAKSLKLDPDKIKIKVQTPGDSVPKVIYENQEFTDDWNTSAITLRENLASEVTDKFAGALFYLDLKKADGSFIHAGTVVTVSYDTRLDMDTKVEDNTTFRESEYYPGGVLLITNNVQGARAFKALDQLPDQAATVRRARSGRVEGLELICDAGAGVSGKYLQNKILNKVMDTDENDQYKYVLTEKAELKGKDKPNVEIHDVMSAFENEENIKNLKKEGQTEEQARSLLQQLDILLRKNLTISNLKLHFGTDSDETDEELPVIYEQDGELYSDEKKIMEGTKTVTVDARDLSNGFSLDVSPMDFGDVIVASYNVDVDWVTFYNEALKQKLLVNGLLLGTVTPMTKLTNKASSGDEEIKHSSESSVEILNLLAEKRLVSNDSGAGKANWEVTASTGYTKGDSLVLRDTVEAELPQGTDASVADAVKAAISLDKIKLVKKGADSLTIYEKGSLTDAAKTAGWKEENVSLNVNGLTIEVTLTNQEGDTLLDSGQTYLLTYQSVLDKEAYFKALTDGGADAEQIEKASYTLKNTVKAERGSASSSADADAVQKPKFPLEASKTGKRSDEKPCSMDWTLTANTGDVARKDFEIRDALVVEPATIPIVNQTSVTGMIITLQTGDKDAETIFDYVGKINELAKYKAHIEKLDSVGGDTLGEFTFEKNRNFGFCLSFGETLPPNTTVTVNYRTTLDRQAYLEAGGTANTVAKFENTMRVSATGSKAVTKNGDGSVLVTDTVSKSGKKVSKTPAGSDVLEWTIPVDLGTEYTAVQLKDAKVSVTDDLNAALSYVNGSLSVYQRVERNGKVIRGKKLDKDQYSLVQNGNQLVINLIHPDQYPAVEIVIWTEVVASIRGLTNTASLQVDGKTWKEESKPVPDVIAAGQSGFIVSMNAPEWIPEVLKHLDGELCTEADAFSFEVSEVNADGTAIDGAYSDEASNDETGKVVFKTIKYKTPTDGEIHYYKIVEKPCDETKYQKDTTEYLVSVKLTKLTNAYQVTITDINSGNAVNGITFQNSSLINISGMKVWDDADDQDGKRPDSVKIHLFADGVEKAEQEVTADAAGNWNWTFEKLPKTADGTPIQYTVTEETVADYTTNITGDAENGFTVTNRYTPGKTGLNVIKVWQDANDRDGKRPDEITVKLLADGGDTGKTLKLNAGNKWSGSFTDLDEYKDGQKIIYTVEEVTVDGYTSSIAYQEDTSSVVITNTHTSEVIAISGKKVWDDKKDQGGKRPDYIELRLLANGDQVDTQVVTEGADGNWNWAFANLPKYKDGVEITYTVTETEVDGYSTVITGDAEKGFTVTNSYTPDKTNLNVTKVWDDANDQDGRRPEEITVKLLADGKDTGKTLKLNADNNWSGSFNGLNLSGSGKEIVYTIEEVAVNGYTTSITYPEDTTLAVVKNTHKPETISVAGQKTWDDSDNKAGKRPGIITIRLQADGVDIESRSVTEADGWKWSFDNLPKYRDGKKVKYTISEDKVPGYQSRISGYNVTNKYVTNKYVSGKNTVFGSWLPKTGDTNKPLLWLALLLLAIGGLVFGWKKRKKPNN